MNASLLHFRTDHFKDKESRREVCVVWLGIEQFPESGAAFKDLRTLGFLELEGARITKNERIALIFR